ncbi:Helix-turn-helix [Bradyrhizobium yuanmingense]|uniref:Helix-turn-helix n=1 Tax=Bradyrhizobium yuanmingense TaxID=108015 RepID=A0A1C3XIK9_9BRAD|nr:helix-turn-helix transcriptional regulator [Bradyrhizobium yuanmingense]TWI17847.1 helix-turn-helix protein [Bradyrhizobium yuanmingense]SCB52117.1 Helix-turn-helix [Bradyrhizobium yuanmingense]
MRPRKPAYTLRLLARNVRERRLRKSWTQYDLADETGLRQALVSQVEAEKANPTLRSLHRIASALGVQVAELLLPQGTVLARGTKPAARGGGKKSTKKAGSPAKSRPR